MTTQEGTRNEAAERLRAWPGSIDPHYQEQYEKLLDNALAIERRATVERIREGYHGDKSHWFGQWLDQLLDEEAAR